VRKANRKANWRFGVQMLEFYSTFNILTWGKELVRRASILGILNVSPNYAEVFGLTGCWGET